MAEADQIRTAWSCRDHIQNGDEEDIDCGGTYCDACDTVGIGVIEHFENAIQAFPNPVRDRISLKRTGFNYDDLNITITNTLGEVLRTLSLKKADQFISVSLENIPAQLILIHVYKNNDFGKAIQTIKVVKT